MNQSNKTFSGKDGINIYVLSLLRTSYDDIKDYQVQDRFEKSWVSVLYLGASVSRKSISTILGNLGKSYELLFYSSRKESGKP